MQGLTTEAWFLIAVPAGNVITRFAPVTADTPAFEIVIVKIVLLPSVIVGALRDVVTVAAAPVVTVVPFTAGVDAPDPQADNANAAEIANNSSLILNNCFSFFLKLINN